MVALDGEELGECQQQPDCMMQSQAHLEEARVHAFRIENGDVLVVDFEDKLKVYGILWGRHAKSGHYRASVDGDTVYIHQMVKGEKEGFVIDHKHGCKWDNRKAKLRYATSAENRANTRGRGSSDALGVDFIRGKGWRARLQTGSGRSKFLGYHQDEQAAASVVREARRLVYGEFAEQEDEK